MPEDLRPVRATAADAAEVLVLQRACWVTEAIVNDTLAIPPLHETLDDVLGWIGTGWVLRDRGRLIGGVRGSLDGTSWLVGRLMVAPDRRGEGLGRALLRHIEAVAPRDATRCALFTGARSVANLALYERAGYRRTGGDEAVVHLEKPLHGAPRLH